MRRLCYFFVSFVTFLFLFLVPSYALESVDTTDIYMSQHAGNNLNWSTCTDVGGTPLGVVTSITPEQYGSPVSFSTWSNNNITRHYRFDLGSLASGNDYSMSLCISLLDAIGEDGDITQDETSFVVKLYDADGDFIQNLPIVSRYHNNLTSGGVAYAVSSVTCNWTQTSHIDGAYCVFEIFYTAGTTPVKATVHTSSDVIYLDGSIHLRSYYDSSLGDVTFGSIGLLPSVSEAESWIFFTDYDDNIVLPSVKIYFGEGVISSTLDLTGLESDVSIIKSKVTNIDENLQAIADDILAKDDAAADIAEATGSSIEDYSETASSGLSGIDATLSDAADSFSDLSSDAGYAGFLTSTLGTILSASPSGSGLSFKGILLIGLCLSVLLVLYRVYFRGDD